MTSHTITANDTKIKVVGMIAFYMIYLAMNEKLDSNEYGWVHCVVFEHM